jgi:endonuclease III
MPSLFEVTDDEVRHLRRLRLLADRESWTSQVSNHVSTELDSFDLDDYNLEPLPSHQEPANKSAVPPSGVTKLRLKISTKVPPPPTNSPIITPAVLLRRRSSRYPRAATGRLDKGGEKENVLATDMVVQKKSKKQKLDLKVTKVALPDGSFDCWEAFGVAGGYCLSIPHWHSVRDWVRMKKRDEDFVAENVAFHRLIVKMKLELNLQSARDTWLEALPSPESANFEICVLFLMVCTPLVPDKKIVSIFGELFKQHSVDIDWILETGKLEIAKLLRPLGRQNDSARYVYEAALALNSSTRFPRDYRELVRLPGIGPKVALVTIQEAFGLVQGVPCDIHMCRIFQRLGWIPTSTTVTHTSISIASILESKKEKEKFDYELSRASIEGWFPKPLWGEMNQTWAGLGQLLNDKEAKRKMASYVDAKVADHDSPWRVSDKLKLATIISAYTP